MNEFQFEHLEHSDINEIRLSELVNDLDNEYTPPISSIVDDLQIYINKILKNAIVIIAKYNEKDIGFIATYCNDTSNRKAYITSLAVKKKYQSKKIGKKLVDISIVDSEKKGMSTIELEVQQKNILAINFYIKYGFNKKSNTSNSSLILEKRLNTIFNKNFNG